MARATSSFPVPLSPVISTGVRVSRSRAAMRSTSWIFAEVPMIPLNSSCAFTRSRRNWFSATSRTLSAMRCRNRRSASTRKGFSM